MVKREAVIEYLKTLTAKQFAEVFYAATAGRHPWPCEKKLSEGRYVLAVASLQKDDPEATWEVAVVCPVPNEKWVDDASLCQHGGHCGQRTVSWAKQSLCPLCGEEVYGT